MNVLILKVTGKGLMADEPIAAYEDTKPEGLPVLQAKHGVQHAGGFLDFVDADAAKVLANRGNIEGPDIDKLQTCWQSKPLAVGSIYAVLTGHDPSLEVAEFLAVQFKKAHDSERFVQAEGSKAFSSGAAAQKNVAQGAKPTGGVWGQKRQGPPRF